VQPPSHKLHLPLPPLPAPPQQQQGMMQVLAADLVPPLAVQRPAQCQGAARPCWAASPHPRPR
jgi:hypothetical protein